MNIICILTITLHLATSVAHGQFKYTIRSKIISFSPQFREASKVAKVLPGDFKNCEYSSAQRAGSYNCPFALEWNESFESFILFLRNKMDAKTDTTVDLSAEMINFNIRKMAVDGEDRTIRITIPRHTRLEVESFVATGKKKLYIYGGPDTSLNARDTVAFEGAEVIFEVENFETYNLEVERSVRFGNMKLPKFLRREPAYYTTGNEGVRFTAVARAEVTGKTQVVDFPAGSVNFYNPDHWQFTNALEIIEGEVLTTQIVGHHDATVQNAQNAYEVGRVCSQEQ